MQFDFQTDPEQAPMAIVIDWDEKGVIAEIALDDLSEEQNTVARELKAWLLIVMPPIPSLHTLFPIR